MTKLVFITTCTARKAHNPEAQARIRDIPRGSQKSVFELWADAIEKQPNLVPADRLYSGRSISEMKTLARQHNAPLYVISAGLGLISIHDKKPFYNLTISGTSQDSVVSKIDSDKFKICSWWRDVNNKDTTPIANLVLNDKHSLFIIAISKPYFEMVREDIESIPPDLKKNIRIFGIKQNHGSPLKLSIMPYDDRFNGPDSPMPGTLSDFPQRCVVHYVKHVNRFASLDDDRVRITKIMESMDWPIRSTGKRLLDDEIIDVIVAEFERTKLSKTKMLRRFRSALKIACEQQRFSRLYNLAMEKTNATDN